MLQGDILKVLELFAKCKDYRWFIQVRESVYEEFLLPCLMFLLRVYDMYPLGEF